MMVNQFPPLFLRYLLRRNVANNFHKANTKFSSLMKLHKNHILQEFSSTTFILLYSLMTSDHSLRTLMNAIWPSSSEENCSQKWLPRGTCSTDIKLNICRKKRSIQNPCLRTFKLVLLSQRRDDQRFSQYRSCCPLKCLKMTQHIFILWF